MRWIFRLIGIAISLVVVGIAALFVIPTDRIARIATDQFTAATGRALSIAGDVRPSLYPTLGIRVDGVTLANASWSDRGPMVSAQTLAVGVKLMPLISGTIEVETFELSGARVVLERRSDGTGNWDFTEGAPQTAPTAASQSRRSSLPQSLSLARATITDSSVQFIDRATGSTVDIAALNATLTLPDLAGLATLDGAAQVNGIDLKIAGTIDNVADLLDGGVRPIDVRLEAGGATVSAKGRLGLTPQADLAVDARVGDLDALMRALGQPAPGLPGGFGRDLNLLGQVTLTEQGGIFLRGGQATVGGNRLALDADLSTKGARPKITARITSTALDVSAFTTGGNGGAGSGGGQSAAGWPKERIDVSPLGLVDADIALEAGAINLGLAKLGRVSAAVALDAGRAVITLTEVAAYDGQMRGEVVVNSRGGLSTRTNLTLSQLSIQPLLIDLADQDRLIAKVNGRINLLMSGNSVDALMRSMSGDLSLSLGAGELLGLDIGGMLRNFDASYRGEGSKTVFNTVSASAQIAGGVATNSDLLFDAPVVRADGAGTVDIGNQTLDYRLTPTALTGGNGITVPVIINGSWANLSYRPDLEALVNQNFAAEREALEQQVQQGVNDALQQELGVNVEAAGGNVEQAVKDRVDSQADDLRNQLENEVGNALRGLLGGN